MGAQPGVIQGDGGRHLAGMQESCFQTSGLRNGCLGLQQGVLGLLAPESPLAHPGLQGLEAPSAEAFAKFTLLALSTWPAQDKGGKYKNKDKLKPQIIVQPHRAEHTHLFVLYK